MSKRIRPKADQLKRMPAPSQRMFMMVPKQHITCARPEEQIIASMRSGHHFADTSKRSHEDTHCDMLELSDCTVAAPPLKHHMHCAVYSWLDGRDAPSTKASKAARKMMGVGCAFFVGTATVRLVTEASLNNETTTGCELGRADSGTPPARSMNVNASTPARSDDQDTSSRNHRSQLSTICNDEGHTTLKCKTCTPRPSAILGHAS